MEVDQIQSKFPRISNGQKMDDQFPDEGGGENKRCIPNVNGRGGGVDLSGGVGRFYGWPSSRIVRVSRASGGKDRHSKVLTSKGLRDRRVRLSVNTAINFYDLQDRLGYDQPSKAVEWLLKAAASSISELPPINSPFPETPTQLSDEKRSRSDQLDFHSADVEMDGGDGDLSHLQQQQVTKSSACSSTSETSKNSGLSLSRSGNRIKARDRAKERVAVKENESSHVASLNPISETTSFTELLSGGINNINNSPKNEFQKSPRQQWSSTTMGYFSSGLLGPQGQMQFVNELKPVASELQNYSFAPDSNLNFTISSAYSGGAINRGTLQSNSSSSSMLPHHIQRFSPTDGSSNNFFIGATPPVENNHHFFSGLQLYNGDAHANNGRQKGKGKNS